LWDNKIQLKNVLEARRLNALTPYHADAWRHLLNKTGLCHIPYSRPYFPSLLSPSFPLCMLYFSRISPATSVHHPT
jgi:hypothetical protein